MSAILAEKSALKKWNQSTISTQTHNAPDYLERLHPHPRDSHISFDEGPHIYTIDGESNYTSVTTWNHSHFPHFNSDAIIKKMMLSPKWPQNKYFGKTATEIKALWKKNGEEASKAGTKMHYDIECFYNNLNVVNNSTEYRYFLNFQQDNDNLIPYRTEWMVWDSELRLAGSIDMVFKEENSDELMIFDWKRCKEIKKTNPWETAKTKCINYMPNTNFWHYSLQLNTYKAILEKNYGKFVNDMYLVCLHPDNKNQSYQLYRVPNLQDQIQELFELRRSRMAGTKSGEDSEENSE
tara:strand:- start:608 stop:1489 length:882 start_codon:yes stop_codon:yes gene_type:complete